ALTNTDLDKAERYSARSLQGDELNPTYLDTYAWVFFKKKDYKMAKQYIDIALNAYAVEAAADTAYAVTDTIHMPDERVATDNISADTENSVETEETEIPSADVYDHAGDIYFMNGEHAKAVEFWEKAHALEPEDETIAKKVKHRTIFFK
ncbi:MAG: tetratricopeptide repeat protein, partial [Muribaculaceae bacterium]|nr:tetratricopeptide repeat protein [Muribaculaceae bacterium]